MKNLLIIGALSIASLNLASCDEPRLVVGEQLSSPVYERPVSPGPDYVWIDGDWYAQGGTYVWHEGRWSRPRSNRTWHAGSWEHRGNGYSWRKGRWH